MPRLFFGLGMDGEIAERLCAKVRSVLVEQEAVRLSRAGDLHLTLAFLGDMSESAVPSILDAAMAEFRGLAAPELRVGGVIDAFPDRDHPRFVFSEVEETFECAGRLAAIRNRVHQVGFSHGWRPSAADRSRKYRPHVTLASLGGVPSASGEIFELSLERNWLPVDITLYESVDSRDVGSGAGGAGGAGDADRYRVRASWPLVVRPG